MPASPCKALTGVLRLGCCACPLVPRPVSSQARYCDDVKSLRVCPGDASREFLQAANNTCGASTQAQTASADWGGMDVIIKGRTVQVEAACVQASSVLREWSAENTSPLPLPQPVELLTFRAWCHGADSGKLAAEDVIKVLKVL